MKVHFKRFSHLCEAEEFTVNGQQASTRHFGFLKDLAPQDADPYGCGNRQFVAHAADPEVLEQFSLTLAEYDQVVKVLERGLSMRKCSYCA
jgi:hypothetical protein